MPCRKFNRHFPDARFGVSRQMVDLEATYVAREHQSQVTSRSVTEIREHLDVVRTKWSEAEQTVEVLVRCLSERDALAFQYLLVRDLFLLMELYASCLKTARESIDPLPLIPAPPPQSEKVLPFSEWLFEPAKS
jgi:hypothetical protein